MQKEKTVELESSLTGDIVTASAKFPGMTINGVEYTEKEPAAKALLDACKGIKDKNALPIGEYMGFAMSLRIEELFGSGKTIKLTLRSNMSYQVDLSTDAFGNLTRINNALADLPKRLDGAKSQFDNLLSQQEAARLELEKPFSLADELNEKEARLALLNAELNIDDEGGLDVENDTDHSDEAVSVSAGEYRVSAKSVRPSLMDRLAAWNCDNQQVASGKRPTERDI